MNCRKVKKGVIGLPSTERGPYKNSMRVHCQSGPTRISTYKNLVGQRIISVKALRVKELQNKLTDAHYHLNELANENRLLKALQKRQDSALKRYEGTNAELPRIINSHQEELKVLQIKCKQLKLRHNQTCDSLKEKEREIHSLQAQNKHLLKLSKDQQLEEREILQMQVSDLKHEIQQQHKTIQILNRKLALEIKKFKHQLNTEVAKHKETRKQLQISQEKLRTLEELLNNREKRLYSNPNGHQLLSLSQRKPTTSQSLTNLRNNSGTSNIVKSCSNSQTSYDDIRNETLPKLHMKKSDDVGKSSIMRTVGTLDNVSTSETMTSLKQVRKFRLQKSVHSRHSSHASDDNELKNKFEIHTNSTINNCKEDLFHKSVTIQNLRDDGIMQKTRDEKLTKSMNTFDHITTKDNEEYHPPEDLMREFSFLSSHTDASNDDEKISPTYNSKNLFTRLINAPVIGTSANQENVQVHVLTSGNSELFKKDNVDEGQWMSLSINNSKKLDNSTLKVERSVNEHEYALLTHHSPLSANEIVLQPSTIKPSNTIDIKNNSIILQQNSSNNSCYKYVKNNEESVCGTDLWMRWQGQLNRVHKKCTDSSQSSNTQVHEHTMKNNLANDFELERKSSTSSDELLHYFDREKNLQEFDKLLISENNLQMPITNGINWSLKNAVITNGKNLPNEYDDVPKDDQKNKLSSMKQPKKIEQLSNTKVINFNKQKLLAVMKAIDDNENIEFTPDKKLRESHNFIRSQVTENLYRGLPTHTKKRDAIIKDIFTNTQLEDKFHSGCSKLH